MTFSKIIVYEPFRRSTSDVFGKVTPVECIYLLLQNSRQTYAVDYHDHVADRRAALSSGVSVMRQRCD